MRLLLLGTVGCAAALAPGGRFVQSAGPRRAAAGLSETFSPICPLLDEPVQTAKQQTATLALG